jgi:Xaa-Pro aminopeptidase
LNSTLALVEEKVAQAIGILEEKGIDLWLTFARGTSSNPDPVLPYIYGHDMIWQGALILTRGGERIVIVGRFEGDVARRTGVYSTVTIYHDSIRPPLLETLERLNPRQIALNFSQRDVHADGLSHGMYGILLGYLEGTPYAERLVSAESIITPLRGRKTEGEIERMKAAIATTEAIFENTFAAMQIGTSERQISDFMRAQVDAFGVQPAWANGPVVNVGPDAPFGLVEPTTERVIERGHIVRIDFGVKQDGYCSDLQRVAYFKRDDEERPPPPVQRAFDTVVEATQRAVDAMRPGVLGRDVDALARATVADAGYEDYQHATGHHLGRLSNDGGWALAPAWEQYGDTRDRPLEAGEVHTVEPVVHVPGYGHIGVEENVVVTVTGAELLGNPQVELIVK